MNPQHSLDLQNVFHTSNAAGYFGTFDLKYPCLKGFAILNLIQGSLRNASRKLQREQVVWKSGKKWLKNLQKTGELKKQAGKSFSVGSQ